MCSNTFFVIIAWLETQIHTYRNDLVLVNLENVTNTYVFPLNGFKAVREIFKRGRLFK